MVVPREARILAAVLYCQNPDVRQMQKLVDRVKWLLKYAPDVQFTEADRNALLTHELLVHFDSTPPRVEDQTHNNGDKRTQIFRKIWAVCCFKAAEQAEETTLTVASAAADQKLEHERRLKEAAARRPNVSTWRELMRKRKAPEDGPCNEKESDTSAMLKAAVAVVEAGAVQSPNLPVFKRLRTLLK